MNIRVQLAYTQLYVYLFLIIFTTYDILYALFLRSGENPYVFIERKSWKCIVGRRFVSFSIVKAPLEKVAMCATLNTDWSKRASIITLFNKKF